jgi:hypothetical protein
MVTELVFVLLIRDEADDCMTNKTFIQRLIIPFLTRFGLGLLLSFVGVASVSAQTVVTLLPMTGSQSMAGKEIAKAVQNQLGIKHKLVFVDRQKYPSFASAWQEVLKHSPDLVIGPVAMEDVADLILSKPNVPVIALNRVAESHEKVWQIGLSLEYTAMQLAEVLRDQGIENVLLFIHDSPTAERSWKAFLEAWQGNMVDVVSFATLHDIKQANRRLLHATPSIQRIVALRKVLEQKVEAMPWVRHDAEVLLMVSPLHEAMELSFRTDHLWDQNMEVYWLDSGSQPINEFISTSVNWGRMSALMSPYLVQAMQKDKDVQPEQNFFRALGPDSALLANLVFDEQENRLIDPEAEAVVGWLGRLSVQAGGKVGIELSQVHLGGGNVEAIE